jgi:hypothetical protein
MAQAVCVTPTLPITGDTWNRNAGFYGLCHTRQGGLLDTGLNNTPLLRRSLATFLLRPEYFGSEGADKLEKAKYQLLYQ